MNSVSWSIPMKTWNKMIRSTNGNGNRAIDVCHWNLGAKKWQNKLHEIQALVDELCPDYCYISEANLSAGLPDHLTNILGYDIITPQSHNTELFSRIVLLAKEGANFTVETNRMSSQWPVSG